MKKVYNFYSDSGHGWLEVNIKEIKEFGLEKKITGLSYKNKDNVYLEEDWDAMQFMNAYKNKYGCDIETNNYNENGRSKIRNYDFY